VTVLWIVIAVVAVLLVAVGALEIAAKLLARNRRLVEAVVYNLCDATTIDGSGAVRSVQSADLDLPRAELEQLWSPAYLERLARTYWRFLSRVTLGLVHVVYTERERFVVLIARPLKLLTFQAPEYEMNADRGIVRWRIERGLLVARRGRGGGGYLQIDVLRLPSDDPERARLHVAVVVSNFYPAIAHRLSRWVYSQTQSRIHVVVTYAFLRSLAQLDLAESQVGLLAQGIEDVPDPAPEPAKQG
jgi:hypothetical protein